MVSKWEAGGAAIVPRPVNQCALDTCLSRGDAATRQRFADALHVVAVSSAAEPPCFEINLALGCDTVEAASDIAATLAVALTGHPDIDVTPTMISAANQADPVPVHVIHGRP